MITQSEYEKAKRIVDEFENSERYQGYLDAEEDEDDGRDWEEEEREREYEELAERASSCKCGAWQFNKKGDVVHIADCCCGAE